MPMTVVNNIVLPPTVDFATLAAGDACQIDGNVYQKHVNGSSSNACALPSGLPVLIANDRKCLRVNLTLTVDLPPAA